MAVKERNAEIVIHSPRFFNEAEKPNLSNDSATKKLRILIGYLSHLYLQGEISDRAVESIINHAYSLYLENAMNTKLKTIELQLEKMLEQSFWG